jgi:hypothetical protein
VRVPFPHILTTLLFSHDCHSVWDEMEFNIVLICMAFIVKDAEHFFVCLLAICIFLRTTCSICPFIIGLFVLFLFSFLSFLYILDSNLLPVDYH